MAHGKGSRMTEAVMERTVSEFARVQSTGQFLWHGGEPLLAGRAFFDKVVALQEALGLRDRYRNTVQSNGVLVDDDWCTFFRDAQFTLGVSLDGPRAIHDALRRFRSGRGSHARVLEAVDRARAEGIRPGVLVVVTRESVAYPTEIFEFVLDAGFTRIDFKPCYGSPQHDVALPDFVGFMKKVLDTWFERNDPQISVRLLEDLIRNLLGGMARTCAQSGRCTDLITVDYDGSVYPCDRFLTQPNYRFGNLLEQGLDDLVDGSPGAQRFRQHVDEQRQSCATCNYEPVCHGGCTHERDYWPEDYCESRAQLIDYIRARLIAAGEAPII
jgi:uncharacterized protein